MANVVQLEIKAMPWVTPIADETLRALRNNPTGLTRTDIRDHFSRNRSEAEIIRALNVLLEYRLTRVLPAEKTRAFWKQKSKKGMEYLSGEVNGGRAVVFPVRKKWGKNSPDYQVFKSMSASVGCVPADKN